MKTVELTRQPRRVSKRQAAAYAGIDPRTLDYLIQRGFVQVYRVGAKAYRIDLDQLDAAMLAYGQGGD